MVRVKLLVQIIPEDVYLRQVNSPAQLSATHSPEEQRQLEVVPHPEEISIGRLAINIKDTYQRINHDLLGDIKYLKHGLFDADLDPEMSVYDAFVDAGKAVTCPDDQTATIKIIRGIKGQNLGVREGPVVPDLSDPSFQPRKLPPVPRFPDTKQGLGKRSRDDAFREDASETEGHLNSTRGRHADALGEDMVKKRLLPSIVEDTHHLGRQPSPVLIPETQDSPLQYNAKRWVRDSLSDVVSISSGTCATANLEAQNGQTSTLDTPQQLQTSPHLSKLESPNMPRSSKRKSRAKVNDSLKPESEQPESHPAVSGENNGGNLSSVEQSKVGFSSTPLAAPDEQLLQDLQASAQGGTYSSIQLPRKEKALAQKQIASVRRAAKTRPIERIEKSSGKSPAVITDVGQKSPTVNQEQPTSVNASNHQNPTIANAGADCFERNTVVETLNQENTQDGKLGLGFSQSPPRKNRTFLHPNVSSGHVGDEGQGKWSASTTAKNGDVAFLKESKSFERVMSSQSWSADTPSRSAQSGPNFGPKLQRIEEDLPSMEADSLGPTEKLKGKASLQVVISSSESQSEPSSNEDSATDVGEEPSKAGQTAIKDGANSASAGATLTDEIASNTASSQPQPVLPSKKTGSKPRDDGSRVITTSNGSNLVNGTPVIVPPGFTMDAYRKMRANLMTIEPTAPTSPSAGSGSRKPHTTTLTQKSSGAVPVSVAAQGSSRKLRSKKNDTQGVDGKKGKDVHEPSASRREVKTRLKQFPDSLKNNDVAKSPLAVSVSNAQAVVVPDLPNDRPPTEPVITASKPRPMAPLSTGSRLAAPGPLNPKPANPTLTAKKPITMSELKAQREADRLGKASAAAAKTAKTPTNPNLVLHKPIFPRAGNSEHDSDVSESESESETETSSSSDETDDGAEVGAVSSSPEAGAGAEAKAKARQGKHKWAKRPPVLTPPRVDLSIRDLSPLSD